MIVNHVPGVWMDGWMDGDMERERERESFVSLWGYLPFLEAYSPCLFASSHYDMLIVSSRVTKLAVLVPPLHKESFEHSADAVSIGFGSLPRTRTF